MKIQFTGIVKSRSARKNAQGENRYYMEVEEPGQYPNQFQLSSKDASVFGPTDSFAKIGASVTVTGYLNSRGEDVPSTKNPGKTVHVYRMWINLSSIVSAGGAAPADADDGSSDEEMPF